MSVLLPLKFVWHTFGTSGAVMKMWFHTAATAPPSSGVILIVDIVVFAVTALPFGLRAKPVETRSQVDAGYWMPLNVAGFEPLKNPKMLALPAVPAVHVVFVRQMTFGEGLLQFEGPVVSAAPPYPVAADQVRRGGVAAAHRVRADDQRVGGVEPGLGVLPGLAVGGAERRAALPGGRVARSSRRRR